MGRQSIFRYDDFIQTQRDNKAFNKFVSSISFPKCEVLYTVQIRTRSGIVRNLTPSARTALHSLGSARTPSTESHPHPHPHPHLPGLTKYRNFFFWVSAHSKIPHEFIVRKNQTFPETWNLKSENIANFEDINMDM